MSYHFLSPSTQEHIGIIIMKYLVLVLAFTTFVDGSHPFLSAAAAPGIHAVAPGFAPFAGLPTLGAPILQPGLPAFPAFAPPERPHLVTGLPPPIPIFPPSPDRLLPGFAPAAFAGPVLPAPVAPVAPVLPAPVLPPPIVYKHAIPLNVPPFAKQFSLFRTYPAPLVALPPPVVAVAPPPLVAAPQPFIPQPFAPGFVGK